MSRYQKGKTNLDFTGARDSEWQWHQLGHMQVCTSLQTDNHTSTPPLSFIEAGCPSCHPTNSVKALKAMSVIEYLDLNFGSVACALLLHRWLICVCEQPVGCGVRHTCLCMTDDGGSQLVVRDVSHSDAGLYQCFVSNAAATVTSLASVTVTHTAAKQQQPADMQNIAPHGT